MPGDRILRKEEPVESLVKALLEGSRQALARLISLVENDTPRKEALLEAIYPHTGRAYVIGVTGSPGSGKSSLVDCLLREVRAEGLSVGVVAVDPTSPFSGGAILGDRIRMQEHALDRGVFIRSMGSRGSLGGLSQAAGEAIRVFDAFGKDLVLVETVGVGQSEMDIVSAADTTLLVLTPAGGDSVQTLKAGVMEVADIFAVNKADLPGAEKTVTEIEQMLDLGTARDHRPAVISTVCPTGRGVDELWRAIGGHRRYLEASGRLLEVRRERVRRELAAQVERLVKEEAWARVRSSLDFEAVVEEVAAGRGGPYSAARRLLARAGLGTGRGEGREGE